MYIYVYLCIIMYAHAEKYFEMLFNQNESDCIYHIPIDLEHKRTRWILLTGDPHELETTNFVCLE